MLHYAVYNSCSNMLMSHYYYYCDLRASGGIYAGDETIWQLSGAKHECTFCQSENMRCCNEAGKSGGEASIYTGSCLHVTRSFNACMHTWDVNMSRI